MPGLRIVHSFSSSRCYSMIFITVYSLILAGPGIGSFKTTPQSWQILRVLSLFYSLNSVRKYVEVHIPAVSKAVCVCFYRLQHPVSITLQVKSNSPFLSLLRRSCHTHSLSRYKWILMPLHTLIFAPFIFNFRSYEAVTQDYSIPYLRSLPFCFLFLSLRL